MNYIIIWFVGGSNSEEKLPSAIEKLANKEDAVARVDELINTYGEPGSEPCFLFLRVFFGYEVDLDRFEL